MSIVQKQQVTDYNMEMPKIQDIKNLFRRNIVQFQEPSKDEPSKDEPSKKIYNKNAIYAPIYSDEINLLIIKTNIINILNMIKDTDDEDKNIIKIYFNLLKNMIILHEKKIRHIPNFINYIERVLINKSKDYDICVIFKMLTNIKNNKIIDNIHFRNIYTDIEKYPPIPIEDRIVLENKVKYMRYSYQSKKKHIPFKVGQIVGAKDKEQKWWLSRILHVHNSEDRPGYWYYIRFEGWGVNHDEWIYSETFRVKPYNSRKHYLKR